MTNTYPKVSIITPSYNQARYLEQCILSVLEQDYPNIEYIIMDGGSTDGSLDIIKKYASSLAYWVSQKDGGQSSATNEGLKYANGDIWAWMNSDDAYLPSAVRKAVDWLCQNPMDGIVYGDCLVTDENGKETEKINTRNFDLPSMLVQGFGIPSGSTFIRRTVSEKIGYLDDSLHYVMDTDYWQRAALVCSFGYIPEPLSLFRKYSSAKTWDPAQNIKRARELILVSERFWFQAGLPKSLTRFRTRSLANEYLYAAYLTSQVNERNLCVQYIQRALGVGMVALRPRLVRLLVYLFLGKKIAKLIPENNR